MSTTMKTLVESCIAIFLVLGCAIAFSAISAYNHGNTAYAIYAVGSATFCGTVAITFAIVRATK
jgi:hypothetical protein